MADRPGPDASSAEIARWVEEDFGEALGVVRESNALS